MLKQIHIQTRLQWATERVHWTTKWREIIFSDEKKFNLDGPDGNQYYWHDLRKEPQYYSRRASGVGSVMVQAAFGFNGKTQIIFLNGRQKAADYICVIADRLLPIGEEIGGRNWIFQQDNALIHTAGLTKTWFRDNSVVVLNWPSRSSDLNPIKSLWGILVRRVYANGRQFNSVTELRAEIVIFWNSIADSELKNLVESMPKRLIEVLKKKKREVHQLLIGLIRVIFKEFLYLFCTLKNEFST